MCVPNEVTTRGYGPVTAINHTSFAPLIKGGVSELIKDKLGLSERGVWVNGSKSFIKSFIKFIRQESHLLCSQYFALLE